MAERLTIREMGQRGDGVADTLGGQVFVPFTLPAEIVTADPVAGHPDRRTLAAVERESPDRIAPICTHFGICGGCAVQHWRDEPYRAWKRALVVDALSHAGVAATVGDVIGAHGDGRRRMVLHARRGTHDVLQVGFAAPRAHHIVPIDRCPILAPGLDRGIAVAWRLAEPLMPTRKPLDIHLTATETGLDVDIRGSGPLTNKLQQSLTTLASTLRLARLTRHGDLIVQREAPTIRMGRAHVALPPGAFLQATAAGEETLAALVRRHVGSAKTVVDLFCGVGPFALRLAETGRVAAFDSDAPAVAALQRAANMTAGLKPVVATARDLFRRPLLASELNAFDAAVFDPPRQGAEAQARMLAQSRVPKVVAVSCNTATFARDAKALTDGGYRLSEVTPVDQFKYTAHIEIVALFEKR